MVANFLRLILYFPVSALVTLFGNILQNPQDPRARSDVRLMNLVVGFLSMLGAEEENGGVKRMLGVCSEFERIAKVVLDKAERDTSSRRKRKTQEDQAAKSSQFKTAASNATKSYSPAPTFSSPPNGMTGQISEPPPIFSPPLNGSSPGNGSWMPDPTFTDGSDYMTPNAGVTPFADQAYGQGRSPLNMNNFQQPFVPQDLWQMPMTLEWDWADMTGGAYPSFENGVLGDINM